MSKSSSLMKLRDGPGEDKDDGVGDVVGDGVEDEWIMVPILVRVWIQELVG